MEPVTTYYLEMTSPSGLRAKIKPKGISVVECLVPQYAYNRFLYSFIGEKWLWTDKLPWTDDEWKAYVESERLRTWVAYADGAIVGYYELSREMNDIEIIYFGLSDDFIGKGIGGYLLSHAISSAWDWSGASRVWVHTCTLDHPGALNNYLSRGMTIYKEIVDNGE